jgi:hypothetical protein
MVENAKNFPTMIIPNGTEVAVNDQGQLSIRTPGNLVIQNSGVYSVIESGNGSVRIDPDVKVEAVSIQAADSCFVAGELTAWRVRARSITLERGAQANIMLQESESLELDRSSRLVGNFASEKELYLMLGRFSRQLRELPENLNRSDREPSHIRGEATRRPAIGGDSERDGDADGAARREQILSSARVILERELGTPGLSETGRAALEKLLEMVRDPDPDALRESLSYRLSQVENPSDELVKAAELLRSLSD